MSVDREELAWAAGFFDGEGNTNAFLRTTLARDVWVVQLAVSQIHIDTLERFKRSVGLGRIYGPYKRAAQDIYTFKVSGFEKVQAIIAMLWPWLTPHKKEQASLALSRYRSTFRPLSTAEERAEALRKYKREWAANSRRQKKVGIAVVVSNGS